MTEPSLTTTAASPVPRIFLPIILLACLALILAAVPWLVPNNRILSIAISTGINAIALYGLSVLFGQVGILSLGHAALLGIGAYIAAILARDMGFGFWLALPFGALGAALFAGLLGFPALRVGGHHFVILTFASGQLLAIVLTNGGTFTGSASGLSLDLPITFFGITIYSLTSNYFLVLAFLMAAIVAVFLIDGSRHGRTWRAIRENEVLAASVGINVGRYKIAAFVTSGLFAGIAGVLLAYFLRHVSPAQFGAFPSVYLALMLMIGGARTLLGPLGGAILVGFLPEIFNLDPVGSRIVYGVCLIAVIMLLPSGLIAGIREATLRLINRRRKRSTPASQTCPSTVEEGR